MSSKRPYAGPFACLLSALRAGVVTGLASCGAGAPAAEQSTFEKTLLSKPAISSPGPAFVEIFHQSNLDARYGLTTDGRIDKGAWRRVYEHVGYLAPYAVYRPDWPDLWRTDGRHLALEVAQSLGRPTGASIFGLPRTPEEEDHLREAYGDPIGLGITHFFNDIEDELGIPGGSGRWRARDLPDDPTRLESGFSTALDTGVGRGMESFTISFGVTANAHYFGGAPQILEMRTADGGPLSISFVNRGGQLGTNRFIVKTGNGDELASPPIDGWLGRQWHRVSISVDGTAQRDRVRLTLLVAGLEDVTTTVPRPERGPRQLSIGGASKHPLDIDDLVINGRVNGETHTLAQYTFESPGAGQPAMTQVDDDSGNGHGLMAASGFVFFPTSGADPERYAQLKQWLVDELLAARAAAGLPGPQVLTNWRLSEQQHRFAAYRPAGFTHGNTVYYLYEPPAGMDPFTSIVEDRRKSLETQWAWDDGSPWSSAWIGNVRPARAALRPEEYRSLITLAVLDGNRYFVVFTGMSGGHLGREGLTRAEAARTNAAALYAMAEAASWFQGTSRTLQASHYLGAAPLVEAAGEVIFRARRNDATGELWFAGMALNEPQSVRVRLPELRGTLTNLATGEAAPVTNDIVTIALDRIAEPYHFRTAPSVQGASDDRMQGRQ